MSSTRIGNEDELHLYINHKRPDFFTIVLEIMEPKDAICGTVIRTDMDSYLTTIENFAKEVRLGTEIKKVTNKIRTRMLKKHNDWPENTRAPHIKEYK